MFVFQGTLLIHYPQVLVMSLKKLDFQRLFIYTFPGHQYMMPKILGKYSLGKR